MVDTPVDGGFGEGEAALGMASGDAGDPLPAADGDIVPSGRDGVRPILRLNQRRVSGDWPPSGAQPRWAVNKPSLLAAGAADAS
jgi:hypothetical protein